MSGGSRCLLLGALGQKNRGCAGILESNRCLPWKILKDTRCSVYAVVVVVAVAVAVAVVVVVVVVVVVAVAVAVAVVVVVVRFFRLMMIPFTSHLGRVLTNSQVFDMGIMEHSIPALPGLKRQASG